MSISLEAYKKSLLKNYEDEINGISYFSTLVNYFNEPEAKQKLRDFALIEAITAKALKPLLDRHQLTAKCSKLLKQEGIEDANQENTESWQAYMQVIIDEFSIFITEFEQLLQVAPAEDKAAIAQLLEHKVVIVEFAHLELAAKGDEAGKLLKDNIQKYS